MDSTTPPCSVQPVPVPAGSDTAISPGPREHIACDTVISGLRSRAETAEAELAEVRQVIATFLAVRGSGHGAGDLAEAVRQVLDRDGISGEEGVA